jgi:hypothetical protein
VAKLQRPAPVLLAPESVRAVNSTATVLRIVDLFRVPERYLRSVHLERDFDDTTSLRHYVVTPPIVAVFSRIIEGLRPESGHRAWRITGDYGTGKSSFALMLAHLLRDPAASALEHVREAIDREMAHDAQTPALVPMVPVLVTGAREPFVPAVARAICRALEWARGQRRANRVLKDLQSHAAAVATAGDASRLLDLFDRLSGYAAQSGRAGVLLVLDELGKFLEYAA